MTTPKPGSKTHTMDAQAQTPERIAQAVIMQAMEITGIRFNLQPMQRLDQAWKLVSTALGYAPEDHTARSYAALSLFRVGTRHLHENRLESALSSFRKMLAYDDGGEAREALTKLLFEDELWEPAVEFFRKWFAQDPSDPSVRHNLAAVLHNAGLEYSRNGAWDTAIQYLEQALQVEVSSGTRGSLAQCYANRAQHKYQMGNQYGAKGDLAVALKHDPSNTEWRRIYRSM